MAILTLTQVDQFAAVRAVSRGHTRVAEEVVETSAAALSELVRTAMSEMRAQVAALETKIEGLESSHRREIAVLKEKNEVLTRMYSELVSEVKLRLDEDIKKLKDELETHLAAYRIHKHNWSLQRLERPGMYWETLSATTGAPN